MKTQIYKIVNYKKTIKRRSKMVWQKVQSSNPGIIKIH